MRSSLGGNARVWVAFFAFVLLFVLMAGSASAQESGTILGVVKDSSGGVVPQAKVTAINTDTTESRTTTTGDDGSYRFPSMPPGHYNVKVEKEGFKTVTQTSLNLYVTQELVVNSTLEIGSAAQEVTVTGEAPIVNTTTSNLGGLVNDTSIGDLPLNGRNYIDLSTLQPGVALYATNTKPGGGSNSGTWLSVNGAPIQSNDTTLDGAIMTNQYFANTGTMSGNTLGIDGIKEYKVLSSVYDATYGLSMGSQTVMVSKGGTNQFHGDIFEYIRNSSLDARNFFDTPASSGGKRLPAFRRNNFGGSVGGPIRKDKTFFYTVYEGLRQTVGQTINDIVLPAACHNLQASTTSPGNYTFPNDTVASSCAVGLHGAGTTNAAGPTVVPAQMVPLVNLYPTPNNGATTWTTPAANHNRDNYGQIRLDQNISSSDTLFGRYTISWAPAFLSGSYPTIFNLDAFDHDQFMTVGETHIFSPTILNTARLSYSRTLFVVNGVFAPGAPNLSAPQYEYVPGISMGDIQVAPTTNIGGFTTAEPSRHVQNAITLSDDLFYTRGRHALKFGVLANRFAQAGLYNQFVGGHPLFSSEAAFMQGLYNSLVAEPTANDTGRNWLFYTMGFYAQDDWRVAPRVTLNLGFRYEPHTTVNEIHGLSGGFRNFSNPAAGFTIGSPFQNTSYTRDFQPRFGFAWDVFGNGKTSVHGGAGLYNDVANMGAALFLEAISDGQFSVFNSVTNNNNTSFPLQIPFNFNVPGQANVLETSSYYMKDPSSIQYNLTVEQQLPLGIGLSVSYVGFQGRHLWRSQELNPYIPTTNANGVQTWDPWICNGVLSAAPNVAGCTATELPNNPAYQRVNPNYGMSVIMQTDGTSTYNALQVALTKHLSRGLEFTGNFTWSHATDATEQQAFGGEGCTGNDRVIDPYNTSTSRGASCYDHKYITNVSVLYHFPNIKSDNIAAKFLHGWWTGNTMSLLTGEPFTANLGTIDRAESGVYSNIHTNQDRVSLGTTTTTAMLPVSGSATLQPITFIPYNASSVILGNPTNWFNPLMFQLQPAGTEGNAPRSLLRGPGSGVWNVSVNKDTRLPFLGEAGNLEFRAEFFNILNRANFALLPSTTVFNGTITDGAGYSEAPAGATLSNPLGTAGKITSTQNTSRQIQFALKVIF